MEKRDFLKKSGTALAVGAVSTLAAPAVIAQSKKVHKLRMVTTWPANFPILQESADYFARRIKEVSDGRIEIQVFAGGELVPPLEALDAVISGAADMSNGAAYYWAGKVPAAQWFAAVPFGLNAQSMNTWFYAAGGIELWEEIYKPLKLIPRPIGNTNVQMGGWFRKKINTMEDFKGLKMRIPGLGGKVLAKAGASVVLLPGSEIFTSLERGVIDATEWVGPLHDKRLGLDKAAPYYYYPGWHEPGTVLELTISADKYNALPKDLQAAYDAVAAETNSWVLSQNDARTSEVLLEILKTGKTELIKFPDEVLDGLRKIAAEVLEEEAAKDAASTKVHTAFKKIRDQLSPWDTVSSAAYYDGIAVPYKFK